MKQPDLFIAIMCYTFAVAMILGVIFAPPEMGKYGWFFAFPAWWLVGVSIHSKASRKNSP